MKRLSLILPVLIAATLCACQAGLAPAATPQPASTPVEPIVRASRGGVVSGTIAQTQGNALTLHTFRGNVLVLLRSGAELTKLVPATAEDLAPGAQASIRGRRNTNGAYEANSVTVTPSGLHTPNVAAAFGLGFSGSVDPPIAGTIESASGDAFILRTDSGPIQVVLLGSARVNKAAPASLGELREGERAVASGDVNVDGSLGANQFQIVSQPGS